MPLDWWVLVVRTNIPSTDRESGSPQDKGTLSMPVRNGDQAVTRQIGLEVQGFWLHYEVKMLWQQLAVIYPRWGKG